ncbi:MAG TPA: hypothetical protein VGS20_07105 [Candidatus Acidoferrales bacterium]|nr:hypothetical protein [Candidatus Acidoferrales bacterium]
MKTISNRKWTISDAALAGRIKAWLVGQGGKAENTTGRHETWRVRQSDAQWTYYSTGTLYVTDSDDPALLEAQRHVDSLAGGRFVQPSGEFLVGLDETGKGEVFGPIVLAAVAFPQGLFRQLEEIIGVADTKVSHQPRYWEELFAKIQCYRARGLDWAIEEITPADADRFSTNRLLDRGYRRLLAQLAERIEIGRARVVLDDYGAGPALRESLAALGAAGAELVRTTHADDRYLECRLASLVAKREQQRALEAIRKDKRYELPGQELGSGNPGDRRTLAWLEAWHRTGKPWPSFVKQSFRTVEQIAGRKAPAKRHAPE